MSAVRKQGFTVWLTGLPCSGKSTLASLLQRELTAAGYPVEVLDGDEVRQNLTKGLGFSRQDRDENVRRIAYVAKLITRVGGIAVAAVVSPYRESRDFARAEIGNFVEVYVSCPVHVCAERDVKELYARAVRGEISNFTGVSDPYEPPPRADVVVYTNRESHDKCLAKIVEKLIALNYIPNPSSGNLVKEERVAGNGAPTVEGDRSHCGNER